MLTLWNRYLCHRLESDTQVLVTSLLVIILCYGSILTTRIVITTFLSANSQSYFSPWILALPQILLLIFVLIVCSRGRGFSYKDLRLQPPKSWRSYFLAVLCVPANILFVVLYMVSGTRLELTFFYTPEIPKNILGSGWFILANLFAICLFVPVVEEIFFRGFLLRLLITKWSVFSSVVLTSLVFAVLHGHLGLLIPVFTCSAVISILYIRSRSIYPPILTHGCMNLLVVMVAASA